MTTRWFCRECFTRDYISHDEYSESTWSARASAQAYATVHVDEDGDSSEGDFEVDYNTLETDTISCDNGHDVGSYIDKDSDLIQLRWDSNAETWREYDEDEDEESEEDEVTPLTVHDIRMTVRDDGRPIDVEIVTVEAAVQPRDTPEIEIVFGQ